MYKCQNTCIKKEDIYLLIYIHTERVYICRLYIYIQTIIYIDRYRYRQTIQTIYMYIQTMYISFYQSIYLSVYLSPYIYYIYNNENNVPSQLVLQWLCGNLLCVQMHDCHKAIVMITRRLHYFHDCIYIILILLL